MIKQTEEHVKFYCRPGAGFYCCRYLTLDGNGWGCEKHTPLGKTIDTRVEAGTFHAVGDNCAGVIPNETVA